MRIVIIAAALLLVGCTDPDTAQRVVEGQGFTDVRTTGYRWFGCSKDDTSSTGFEATDQRGRRVTGVVCSSWSPFGKSSTVRID